jgi:hypothetical protein
VLSLFGVVLLVLTGTTTRSTVGDLLILAVLIAVAVAIGYGFARLVAPRR